MTPIVSVDWLMKNRKDIVLLDAEALTPNFKIIPGARIFNLKDDFQEKESPYPNTYPNPGQFEKKCQELGINQSSKIVVYDHKGIYTSPRVWWLFQLMGHYNISVLDGGLPEWESAGNKTAFYQGQEIEVKGNFKANFQPQKVKHFAAIQQNILHPSFTLVDARSSGRFLGVAPEPREGLRSGSIPNSINIPYSSVLEKGKFKSEASLKKVFNELIQTNQPTVFSCGSGITACIILLASELVYQGEKSVYDGSWTEWAMKTK